MDHQKSGSLNSLNNKKNKGSLIGYIKTLYFQINLKGFSIFKDFTFQLAKRLHQWIKPHSYFTCEFIVSNHLNFVFKFAFSCSSLDRRMQTI